MRIRRFVIGLCCAAVLAFGPAAPNTRAADDKKESKKEDKKEAKKDDKQAAQLAHIRIAGELDEAPLSPDPLFGGGLENFKSKLDRIKKAKNDPKVKGLYLQIEDLELGLFGFAKVDELRRAIADFRKSGKKTYAFLESASGKDYLIALACDVVALPEGGSFEVTGMRVEMSFYKDLLDKIGVKADFLQMGEAKGAAEPFTRRSMSEANRKQFNLVLDDYYEKGLIQAIVEARPKRKWTADQVKKLIDEAPYTARKAKGLGLIDVVAYPHDFEESLKADLKADSVKIVRNYGAAKIDDENPLALLMKMMSPPKSSSSSKKPKIAVVYAVGEIHTGKNGGGLFGGSSVGSTTTVEAIKKADADPTVKAIVLRVDSPGGSALASDLIWHAIKNCKKPVIASMGDIAASGGYYISMSCKKIYAEPGTLTGSIGVVGGKLVTRGLWEWAGVNTEVIARGKNSGVYSSNTEFSKTERDAIGRLMQDIYDQFIDKAVAGRKAAGKDLTREKLLPLAGGRIWTGRQAKDLGLVDELGTLDDAIAEAKKLAGAAPDAEMELLILPRPHSFLDRLAEGKSEVGSSLRLADVLLPQLQALPEAKGHLRAVEGLLRMQGDRVWLMAPYRISVK